MTGNNFMLGTKNEKESKGKGKTKGLTPLENALNYLKHETDGMVHLLGNTYTYDGTRYVEKKREDLEFDLRFYLMNTKQNHTSTATNNLLKDVLTLAHRRVMKVKQMPCWTGTTPFPKEVIPLENGLLNVDELLLGNVVLIPHSKDWLSTFCLPYKFDSEAECPLWTSTLEQVFDGDSDRIRILQEWFGYCLLADTSQHKALLKVGPPRAFKGTTDRILQAMLGEDNTTGFNLHSLADKFGLHRLVGKHVAFVGEVNIQSDKDKYRILETLNSIIGGDPIAVEEKYGNVVQSIRLPTRFSICCNELPQLADHSGALASRMIILNYDNSNVGKEDRQLETKLLKELAGILNWSLAGLVRLKQQGKFSQSSESDELLEEQRRNNSQVYHFLCECVEVQNTLNTGNLGQIRLIDDEVSIRFEHLIKAYQTWCQDVNQPSNCSYFPRQLRILMPKLRESRKLIDGKKIRFYSGLRIAI